MLTTLDIPKPLFTKAEKLAAQKNTTLKAILITALDKELKSEEKEAYTPMMITAGSPTDSQLSSERLNAMITEGNDSRTSSWTKTKGLELVSLKRSGSLGLSETNIMKPERLELITRLRLLPRLNASLSGLGGCTILLTQPSASLQTGLTNVSPLGLKGDSEPSKKAPLT